MDEKKNKATSPIVKDPKDLTPEAIDELSNGKGDDDDE
jgi:hypothetical protein